MTELPRHRGAIIEATVPVGADEQAPAMLVLRDDDNIVWDSLTRGTYPTYVISELTDVTVHFAGIGAREVTDDALVERTCLVEETAP